MLAAGMRYCSKEPSHTVADAPATLNWHLTLVYATDGVAGTHKTVNAMYDERQQRHEHIVRFIKTEMI